MNKASQNILKTLAYFDVFNYPLTREEILSFSSEKHDQSILDESLNLLLSEHVIFKLDEFYALKDHPVIAERRRLGNKHAIKQIAIAEKVAKILSWFPFVQSIAVSGSLSKNFAAKDSDIDFFIITSANRLWIARTCMHLLKKLSFLVGKQHWFCMNYYIDEISLVISEKNIFTAMEIVTLLPLQGKDCFKNFIEENSWTNKFFPEKNARFIGSGNIKKVFLRKCFEKIFFSRLGDITDRWLMNLTDKRWVKKTQQGKVNNHGVRIGMMVSRHFSKPDPRNFQAKVVQQYESRVQRLLNGLAVSV
ncbi:MAG TPA: nucleotidyltransferase domain-containing protein [Hanamia sp.]|nr:nucleotidyltransferase domain-containing protein [Hanamia sp.]